MSDHEHDPDGFPKVDRERPQRLDSDVGDVGTTMTWDIATIRRLRLLCSRGFQ